MRLNEFTYHLPPELIASHPMAERSASRLLCLKGESGEVEHSCFSQLPALLQPNDLLVFNDTRVIPARLFGRKETGGQLEILIERLLDDTRVMAQVRASKSPKIDSLLYVEGVAIRVLSRDAGFFELGLEGESSWQSVLDTHGHMPLPPYIERPDEIEDRERYQTVYASNPGAVAAPTAGLHFDEALLQKIKSMGVDTAFVTLHVGAGTFQPVRVDDIEEHRMHKEYIDVSQSVCDQIKQTQAKGGRVIAAGTTSVRCLETATGEDGVTRPFAGDTDIFIYPGRQFRCVDALITNFHLPESTLLMLVSAFAGKDNVMNAYQAAIQEKYRFFSYGDAMFITPNKEARVKI